MPPVEEWSCFVTIEERMVRLDETMLAQESSHDVSMPRISLGWPDVGPEEVKVLSVGFGDGRKHADVARCVRS